MNNAELENDNVEIKETNLKRMVSRIAKLERNNSKTGSMTDKDMRLQIQSIIEEEANKCY